MICYPANTTDADIALVNDYWLLSDESSTVFAFALKKIESHYKDTEAKALNNIARKSTFVGFHPAFTCQECERKLPVKNRKEFTNRVKNEAMICPECIRLEQQDRIDRARRQLNEYKIETFKSSAYLDRLNIEESLWLLSLSAEKTEGDQFLGSSPSEVIVTGVHSIDQRIVNSLIDKKALIHIADPPMPIKLANITIYGSLERLRYDSGYQMSASYRPPGSLFSGVYLRPCILGESLETSDISSFIYQKLHSCSLSVEDALQIRQLITEVQIDKLYNLVTVITKEYKIPINNSGVLRSLINHLADNYSPRHLFFTFHFKARETIVRIHKDNAPRYIARNYFTQTVGNHIKFLEHNNLDLLKIWDLPPEIETSPFEALFSQIYLEGHFDWNMLSAKEVVALWLDKVSFAEDAQKHLT